jgi:hypothetical protein
MDMKRARLLWLRLGLAAGLLLAVALWLLLAGSAGVTRAQYDKIQAGMAKEEVGSASKSTCVISGH